MLSLRHGGLLQERWMTRTFTTFIVGWGGGTFDTNSGAIS